MSTQRERDEAKRERKLRDLQEAQDSGSLVIRKMTPDERERYPARTPPEGRRRRTPRRG